ncbi:MAG TPA: hypothetical protein ENK98_08275 [Epsilonproteobacteria bacterium]|nr:hypothetical protein [Campylobacterota bacterium]
MEHKIAKAVEEIQKSKDITAEEKPLILNKIEEWKEEKTAISELNQKLQEWWLKVEPIFAEIGLV